MIRLLFGLKNFKLLTERRKNPKQLFIYGLPMKLTSPIRPSTIIEDLRVKTAHCSTSQEILNYNLENSRVPVFGEFETFTNDENSNQQSNNNAGDSSVIIHSLKENTHDKKRNNWWREPGKGLL